MSWNECICHPQWWYLVNGFLCTTVGIGSYVLMDKLARRLRR